MHSVSVPGDTSVLCAGYIQLICCVPTGWQKLSVTFTPTFVANKSLTFSLNSSDLTQV